MKFMNEGNAADDVMEIGITALEAAEFEDAIEIFERAAVEDSQNARAWFYLGLCYLETSRPDFAAEALQRAINADPGYADAHYLRGTAAGALGQIDEAAQCYRSALAADPRHQKAEEFLIRTEALLASREHYRTAMQLIHREPHEPGWINPSVRELLHSVAIFADSPARAEFSRVAAAVLQSNSSKPVRVSSRDDGPFWAQSVDRAEHAFRRQVWPEAAACYHEALDLSPDHAFIHHMLGLVYFQLGDVQAGSRSWQQAVDLDPDFDFSSIWVLAPGTGGTA
ncbi:MAG TPA: tetratricopeptide repeat protein [Blastocatellia bacterium]|nr:tetratricopeptide repeat protein [Blastocatellia bacterium]